MLLLKGSISHSPEILVPFKAMTVFTIAVLSFVFPCVFTISILSFIFSVFSPFFWQPDDVTTCCIGTICRFLPYGGFLCPFISLKVLQWLHILQYFQRFLSSWSIHLWDKDELLNDWIIERKSSCSQLIHSSGLEMLASVRWKHLLCVQKDIPNGSHRFCGFPDNKYWSC